MFFKESKKSDSFLPMSLKESIIMKTAAQDRKDLCGGLKIHGFKKAI